MSTDRLALDLDAFIAEHRRCGDPNGEVEGDRVWMTCSCGAVTNRKVNEEGSR